MIIRPVEVSAGLAAMSQAGRRVCAVCGSTRFRLLSSQLVCAAGHIQRDFRIEAAHDDDGFETQITTRSRSQNRATQRDAARLDRRLRQLEHRRARHGRDRMVFPGSLEHAALADPDEALLSGARASFAVVQCLQLVLRQQVASLHEAYPGALPEALEVRRSMWLVLTPGNRTRAVDAAGVELWQCSGAGTVPGGVRGV